MNTTVYLLRHGAYENPKQIFHGRLPGFPLSAEGKKAAQRMAAYLAKKPIVAVYSSRLTRAHQTAEIIAKAFHKKVQIDRRLLDIRTPLQGKPYAFARTYDGNFYQDKLIRKGAERLPDVFSRIDRFLRGKVKIHAGRHFVVVTHGDLIMSVYDRYSGRDWPRWGYSFKNWYVPQASGLTIEFDAHHNPVRVTKLASKGEALRS